MKPIHVEVVITHGEVQLIEIPQPEPPDPRWWVEGFETVHIDPGAGGDQYPVFMRFQATFPISAVGFLQDGDDGPIAPFNQKGPCGGCFFLECDVDPSSEVTPLIRNDGPGTDPPTRYHLMFWLEEGEALTGCDPQIYNEGSGTWPWWRRWLRRLRGR